MTNNTKHINDLIDLGKYEEDRMDEFKAQLYNYLDGITLEEADIDFFQGFLDSFTFPDEDEWATDIIESEFDDIGDQKYEQMRDERTEDD